MTTFNFIGVDVSKDSFDVALANNSRFLHKRFFNHLNGFNSFLEWIKQHAQNPWVCMEATGHYSEGLADFLCAHNISVSVVNPLKIKYFAKALLARNKNDKADAIIIAQYAEAQKPRLFKPKSSQQKTLRELIQLHDTLKEQGAMLKNQLHSRQTAIAQKELQKIIATVDKRCERLLQHINSLVQSQAELSAATDLLCSIKGIGQMTAYRILAYIPDISLFENAKQLAAFMGLSPRQRESGQWKGKTCLSKFGHAYLRQALYMPALSAKRHNEHLQPFVIRLKNNGLAPKAIIGAVMRKLVHIIFGILKSAKPFDANLVAC